MTPAAFIRECITGLRADLESLNALQRFACDLRSVDRFKAPFDIFAAGAGKHREAEMLEVVLNTLWRTGDGGKDSTTTVRSLSPDAEGPSAAFLGTARSVIFQLSCALEARFAGTISAALQSLDSSLETAYMCAQEKGDDAEAIRMVRITHFGSAQHAADQARWLVDVRFEAGARARDCRSRALRDLTSSTFASFRDVTV
jgi:hypothetical protein